MMRSLWTSASGMKSQQRYIDNISNNIANVNSIGFKKSNMEFKSLFYETLDQGYVDENGFGNPTNLEVGHGVKAAATYRDFSSGGIELTDNPLDFALDGDGFFEITNEKGEKLYTKAGAFRVSLTEDSQIRLATADGYQLLSTDGDPIEFDSDFNSSTLGVDASGNLSYTDTDGTVVDLDAQIAIAQFSNPAGLDAVGGSYFMETATSGEVKYEADDDSLEQSNLIQGALEASNVQVVDEMVKLIVAQRAYELNTKSIETADEILSLTNNIK